ncbi:MAG: hypothetical protein AAF311_00180 [Pseudomonadota bacterium]
MTLPDMIGLSGVACVLFAYWALQTERLKAEDWRFSAVNAMGAVLILVSLHHTFNLASFVIEVVWLAISLFGLWKAWRRRTAP